MVDKVSSAGGEQPPSSSKPGYQPANWFWETRKQGQAPLGTLVFSTLRALDVPFQWWLFRSGTGSILLQRLGANIAAPASKLITGTPFGISPYHVLIVGLAAGSSLKQIHWKLFVGQEIMTPQFAALVGVYNTLLNSSNALMALWLATSQQPSDQSSITSFIATAPASVYIGVPFYLLGLYLEWRSEIQRKNFKNDPNNQGKPYAGGLFGLARNINYGGYTIWRFSYSLTCGGWLYGATVLAWLASDFCARAIPSMDAYCEQKYGEQWDKVRRQVPYKLLPWIW